MKQTIIHGDALEVLPKIEDESIDLILTDPPYNISNGTKITRRGGKFGKAKDINLDFGEWDHSKITWQDYIDDFARVLKPCGVLVMFYDRLEIGSIGKYLQNKYNFKVRHMGAWVKTNPVPQARKVKWQTGTEFFIVTTKNTGTGHHFNYKLGQSPDYYMHSVSYKHYHPTQKPEALIEWIMKYWSFEGDTVLDPFAGSGTTLAVARKLNRSCISVEISKKFVELIKDRLDWGTGIDVEYIYKEVI